MTKTEFETELKALTTKAVTASETTDSDLSIDSISMTLRDECSAVEDGDYSSVEESKEESVA